MAGVAGVETVRVGPLGLTGELPLRGSGAAAALRYRARPLP
jgi:hypothetical protein